jgi:hypothetical protein
MNKQSESKERFTMLFNVTSQCLGSTHQPQQQRSSGDGVTDKAFVVVVMTT